MTAMKDYNTDFALWAEDQAAKLRCGKVTELDRDNLAEELGALARALRDELFDRLGRLLQNLVQWDYLDGVRLPDVVRRNHRRARDDPGHSQRCTEPASELVRNLRRSMAGSTGAGQWRDGTL